MGGAGCDHPDEVVVHRRDAPDLVAAMCLTRISFWLPARSGPRDGSVGAEEQVVGRETGC